MDSKGVRHGMSCIHVSWDFGTWYQYSLAHDPVVVNIIFIYIQFDCVSYIEKIYIAKRFSFFKFIFVFMKIYHPTFSQDFLQVSSRFNYVILEVKK